MAVPLSFGAAPVNDYTRTGPALGYGSTLSQYGAAPAPSSFTLGSVSSGTRTNSFMPSYTPSPAPLGGTPVAVPAPAAVPAPSTPDLRNGFSAGDVVGNDALSKAMRGAAGNDGWFNSTFRTEDGGLNLDAFSTVLKGIGSIGSLWGAFQQNRLARDMFDYQKDAYETNVRNQTQSYNTALEDRVRARYSQEGRSRAAADRYIENNSLRG